MKDFMFKLDRCIWLAFLNQDKIYEAYESFNSYLGNLYKHKRKPEVKEEIEFTQKLFYTTLFEKNKIYLEKEDYSNALLTSNIMFNIDKFHVDAIKNYIKALVKTNQKDLCVDMIDYLKTITNDDKSIYKYFAEIFNEIKDYENAIKYLTDYIELKPENEVLADDYNLLGCYYNGLYNKNFNLGVLENALSYYKLAYERYPEKKAYLSNICMALGMLNRPNESLQYWKQLLQIGTLSHDEEFEYSAYCLKMGNFKEYYKYSNSRFTRSIPAYFPKIKKLRWNCKDDITDKILLVHWEQGFGDVILYSGFLKRLRPFAKEIIFVVQDALYPLLKNNNCNIKVMPESSVRLEALEFDLYIPAMDIYNALNLNKDTAVSDTDFIILNTEKVNYYKEQYFKSNKLKVGISCFGHENGPKFRDIPLKYIPLFDNIDNADLYFLNKNVVKDVLPKNSKNNYINIAKSFNSFDDTAAAIANCDLIISADNCILNLAGALNKKTYGLFNWCYEFRWYDLSGGDVGWYKSVRPFVNEKMNDWGNTIEKITDVINNEKLYKKE